MKPLSEALDDFMEAHRGDMTRFRAYCRANNPILYSLQADNVIWMLIASGLLSTVSLLFVIFNLTELAVLFSLLHVCIVLFLTFMWAQFISIELHWETSTFATVFHYRFLYVCGMALVLNVANLVHIPFVVLSWPTSHILSGVSVDPLTVIVAFYGVALWLISLMALWIHALALQSVNNDSITGEVGYLFRRTFGLVFVTALCFVFSTNGKTFWAEPFLNFLNSVLVIKFERTLFLLYTLEVFVLVSAVRTGDRYRKAKLDVLSSSEFRSLQSFAVPSIIIALGILTHWTLALVTLPNIAAALLLVFCLYVIVISSVERAYRFGESVVMGPWR